MYRRSCVVLEAKRGKKQTTTLHPSSLLESLLNQTNVWWVWWSVFFPVSYVVPLLRRWGKLGLLLNGRQAFIARGISPVSTPVYIISLAWNEKQLTETYREVIHFRVTFSVSSFWPLPFLSSFFYLVLWRNLSSVNSKAWDSCESENGRRPPVRLYVRVADRRHIEICLSLFL